MSRKIVSLALAAGMLLSAAPWATAQVANSTISGTVTDPSGAIIPGAKVTVTNQGTNTMRVVQSNTSGYYTVSNLPVATYTVSAAATGFKTSLHSDIMLDVATQKVVDITLQIGKAVQTVEVTGGALLVETRTAVVGSVVTPTQMSELPLNGRNFFQLVALVPGASLPDNFNAENTGLLGGSDVSVSGGSANTNSFRVDNAQNVDEGSGRTLLVYPSVDSIQEFKVERNAMGAENASSSGAIITVITKTGTNRFHGTAYDFFRNDKLDASSFFLNSGNQKKPERRLNDFGFTFGGPVIKDKVFFFASEEWHREIRALTRRATVPTLQERNGNFNPTPREDCSGGAANCLTDNASVPIDPFTGNPFPGNQIPACAPGQTTDCLSPAGVAINRLFPLPTNNNTTFNWTQGLSTPIPTRADSIRGDWTVNDHVSVSAHYSHNAWDNPAPNAGSENGLWGDTGFPTVDSTWSQPSELLSGQLTQTFGGSAVNNVSFTFSTNQINISQGLGKDINDSINAAIPTVFPHPGDHSHAIFWGAPPNGQSSLWNEAPWTNGENLFAWQDDFTKTKGKHTFKMGGLIGYNRKTEPVFGASQVSPQFWGPNAVPGGAGVGGGWGPASAPGNGSVVTGNNTADLLLRGAFHGESGEASAEPVSFIRWKDYEAYFADDWRVTPRLTLNLGVRWDYFPPAYNADDHIGNFVPQLFNPALGATPTNGLIFPSSFKDPALGITGGAANLRGFGVGRALRFGSADTFAPRFGFAWDPTGAGKWAIRGGFGIFHTRADLSSPNDSLAANPPFVSTANCPNGRPLDSLGDPSLCATGLGTPTFAADTNDKIQGSYQWNFTIERQLARDTKLELTYVGNRGVHLPIQFNLNQTPLADFAEFQRIAFSPNSNNAQFALQPLNVLKAGSSLPFETQGGNSSHEAFELELTKSFSRGFSFNVSYAVGKTLGNTTQTCCAGKLLSVNEIPNRDRGFTDFDRRHILTINGIYDVPSFRSWGPLFSSVLGSWETSAIYSYSSGLPLFVTGGVGNCPASSCRPDFLASVQPRTPEQFFSPLDFGTPTVLGDVGNSAIANLHGPSLDNFDISLMKNIPLNWEGTKLQFRVETFNTFNHTQLLSVDTNFTARPLSLVGNTIGCVNSAGVNLAPFCNINGTFGKALSARTPREIQLALKFIF